MDRFLLGIAKLFLGRALSVVSNILIAMLISRLTGSVGFGIYATILTTGLFCSNICKFGLEQIALAEAPRVGKNKIALISLATNLLPLFGLGAFLSLLIIISLFLYPSFNVYFSSFQLAIYVAVFVTFFSYQFILGEFFRSREAFLWASVSKGGLSNLIMLSFLIYVYLLDGSEAIGSEMVWLLMAISAGTSALTLTLVLFLLRWDAFESEALPPYRKRHLKTGSYFLLTSLIIFLVSQSDIWISAIMFGAADTGFYAAASRIVFLTTFMASLINGLFTPKLSLLAASERMESFEEMLRAISLLNAISGFIVIIPLMSFAESVVTGVFGDGFERSGVLLRILLFGQIASVLVGPVGYALVILGQSRALLIAAMVGLITGLGLVLIFSIWGLNDVKLAFCFAVANIALQVTMFLSLKRSGVSALPSFRKIREAIYA